MTLAPGDRRHGTANGYCNLKCRCDMCRAAWAKYHRELMHKTARRVPREDYNAIRRQNLVHGTEAGGKRGCKCSACKHAAYIARWQRRWTGEVRTHNASGYKNGCRCATCRDAIREYRRERRAA